MGRRSQAALILLLPAFLPAAAAVLLAGCGTPPIGKKAVGLWRETEVTPAYRLRVERSAGGAFVVTYPAGSSARSATY